MVILHRSGTVFQLAAAHALQRHTLGKLMRGLVQHVLEPGAQAQSVCRCRGGARNILRGEDAIVDQVMAGVEDDVPQTDYVILCLHDFYMMFI